jgi:hypothetical protein
MSGTELGSDGREMRIEFFDVELAEVPLKPIAKALPIDERGAGEIEIQIAEHAAPCQLARELLERVEMAGRMTGADDGAYRSADDDVRLDAGIDECLDDTDMSPAAGGSAPKRQTDLRLGHVVTCCVLASTYLDRDIVV